MRLKPTYYLAQIPYPDKFHFLPLPIKKKKSFSGFHWKEYVSHSVCSATQRCQHCSSSQACGITADRENINWIFSRPLRNLKSSFDTNKSPATLRAFQRAQPLMTATPKCAFWLSAPSSAETQHTLCAVTWLLVSPAQRQTQGSLLP